MRARVWGGALSAGWGVGVAAAAPVAARRRAEAGFYESQKVVAPPAGSGWVATFPAVIHRMESFGGIFSADGEAVRGLLPDGLHPVRLPDGRALLMIQAVRFHEVTSQHVDGPTLLIQPYAEVVVGALVTRRRLPPLLPLIAGSPGIYPLAMPVTSREARDPGLAMGLPKFIADLDFDDDVTSRSVRVSEDGAELLRLTVSVDGPMTPRLQRQSWFSVHAGKLQEVVARTHGYGSLRFGGRAGHLQLGTHQVVGELGHLKIADVAVATLVFPALRGLMPAPRPIRPAVARWAYRGRDRDFGRYTVRHPHTDAVDQNGPTGIAASAAALGLPVPSARVDVETAVAVSETELIAR